MNAEEGLDCFSNISLSTKRQRNRNQGVSTFQTFNFRENSLAHSVFSGYVAMLLI